MKSDTKPNRKNSNAHMIYFTDEQEEMLNHLKEMFCSNNSQVVRLALTKLYKERTNATA